MVLSPSYFGGPVQASSLCNTGTCLNGPNGAFCTCSSGFTGKYCNTRTRNITRYDGITHIPRKQVSKSFTYNAYLNDDFCFLNPQPKVMIQSSQPVWHSWCCQSCSNHSVGWGIWRGIQTTVALKQETNPVA